ncbi:MAG: hypothetical protein IKK75_10440 [Clostridia bacterium]|nr:hypothetical protein [Clostridia bacterium]
MKKAAIWLLIGALILSAFPAFALTNEEALDKVNGYLTEVYGYTAEQAEAFEANVVGSEITFWPANNPLWQYKAVWNEEKERLVNAETPFRADPQHIAYPGESAVRMGLNQAREEGWFTQWNAEHRQAMAEYMAKWIIKPTARLAEGLSLGQITAGDALHEFFVSAYGDSVNWSYELHSWHDEELKAYNLSFTNAPPVTEGVVTYQTEQKSGQDMSLTRFIGEVPQQLQQLFDARPELEGWTCICGAVNEGIENQVAYGLAVFEKNGERLLVAMQKMLDGSWVISPVSKQALYTDRAMYIEPATHSLNYLTIVYQNSETETERFQVAVSHMSDDRLDASLSLYTRMDEATGDGIRMEFNYSATKVNLYEKHQRVGEEKFYASMQRRMGLMDIEQFPTTAEDVERMASAQIPDGYVVVGGVHLRQKTSSRSKDLGDYNGGVLARLLGTAAGDPDPWYHVQIGQAEGYMSSRYVIEPPYSEASLSALPIAQAQKEIRLKNAPGWLSGTVQKVPEGTRMHVLAEVDGGWLHVCIPQKDTGWQMDINGIYGYVREKDVRIADTPLNLDGLE